MPYITDPDRFIALYSIAKKFPGIDKAEDPVFAKTSIFFDPDNLLSKGFFAFLKEALTISADRSFVYIMVDPDPLEGIIRHGERTGTFLQLYDTYPAVGFTTEDTESDYYPTLGGISAPPIVFVASVYAVFPPSLRWWIYGDVELEVAYLHSPYSTVFDRIQAAYGSNVMPVEEVLEAVKRLHEG
ncbi:hypothetical protein [Gloeobacter morelensis]|uniref:Uncharacterized protein n=1 Tax=Gloeobacter morelensis MG652769 TaxID=2781736 RepID=A0ABY3PKN6_9CYAN|nr:hypothetical protein [Gloeobacter morelensis]UFP94206.1 hypothetical protein ISF26_20990 [Gloeobacter morelensis MG652769]